MRTLLQPASSSAHVDAEMKKWVKFLCPLEASAARGDGRTTIQLPKEEEGCVSQEWKNNVVTQKATLELTWDLRIPWMTAALWESLSDFHFH